MEEAINYILEAQGYLNQLTPEVDLETLLCEDEECQFNNSTISIFLESGNTDGKEKPSNNELKSKANEAHKNALEKILDAIKSFIKKIIDFFKDVFGGGKDSVPQSMHDALDAVETVIPDAGNARIEIVDKNKFFKEAKTRLKELNKARKTHNPQKIDEAKKNLQVTLDQLKKGKVKTVTVSLQDAIKMVEACEDNTKRDTIELQKLQRELEKIESKISDQTATQDNSEISAAQFEASAQMLIAAEEQKAAQGTTVTFFGALKSFRKFIKANSPIEKVSAAAEVMDAAANNPRVNKFCKAATKVGSVLFDGGGKDKSVLGSWSRAREASDEANVKRGLGRMNAKRRALGGYSTALNTALNNPYASKIIGGVGNAGRVSFSAANKFINDMSEQLDREAQENDDE